MKNRSVALIVDDLLFPWQKSILEMLKKEYSHLDILGTGKSSFHGLNAIDKLVRKVQFNFQPVEDECTTISTKEINEAHKLTEYDLIFNLTSISLNIAHENTYQVQIGSLARKGNNPLTLNDLVLNNGVVPFGIGRLLQNRSINWLELGFTQSDHISLTRNYRNAGFALSRLFRKLLDKKTFDEPHDVQRERNYPIKEIGSLVRTFRFLRLNVRFFFSKLLNRNKEQKWRLGMTCFHPEMIRSLSLSKFRDPLPKSSGQQADPFIFEWEGKSAVFFEYIPENSTKGEIHAAELSSHGELINKTAILIADYHLAYPYVFEFQGNVYMVPDSGHNETVDLYLCEEFPNKWKWIQSIFKGVKAVDSTLFEYDNKWWLFCNVVDQEGLSSFDCLHIYHAENPITGDWKEHAQNPIMIDASASRPAGRVFSLENQLIRPSQNSSHHYGYGLNFNRIELLTESEYREVQIQGFTPEIDQIRCCHTFNFLNKIALVDIKRFRNE